MLIVRANEGDCARFGVVASRKVGSAVVRNRCKRLLREAARALLKQMDLSGIDLLLIARPPCKAAGAAAVLAEVERLYISARGQMPHARQPERPNAS